MLRGEEHRASTMDRKQQAQYLAEVLLAAHDEAACTACLDELEEYVSAQLRGEPYQARFPQLAAHLDSCVDCAEAYAALYEVLQPQAALATPQRIPAPDLSFLDPKRATNRKPILVQLARAIREALAAPSPPTLAYRDAEETVIFSLAIEGLNAEIERVQVAAYPAENAEHCLVQVQVELRDRAWPDLADIALRLSWPDGASEASTDSWGSAVFAAVPRTYLAELSLTVSL